MVDLNENGVAVSHNHRLLLPANYNDIGANLGAGVGQHRPGTKPKQANQHQQIGQK